MEDPEVKRLLEADVDRAGAIATHWSEAIRRQFAGIDVELREAPSLER